MPWYERELHTLWKECQVFSKHHPQLTKYLSFSHGRVDDPHAARTMEAFALLNARLSRQLENDSNKITAALLQLLFPVSIQSLPSVSIIHIPPSKEQTRFTTLPKNTRFWIYNDDRRYCQFHTTRRIDLCPFDIVSCHIEQRPFDHSDMSCSSSVKMLLKLTIAMLDDTLTFSDCGDFSNITVQLSGLFRLQTLLYDILNRSLSVIILSTPEGDQIPLPSTCFSAVGFEDECIMRTNPSHNLLDHQKMFELFAWPELFFCFELKELGRWLKHCQSNEVTLTFCLSSHSDELMQNIGLIQFLLGCAPIVNVFEHIAEPITIDHKQLDYPIIPDVASKNTMEIQDIVDIIDITKTEPERLPNLFGLRHNEKGNNKFWLYRPPDNEIEEHGHLEIIYTELDPYSRQVIVLSPHVLCNNGKQVMDLPDNPKLECIDSVTLPEPDNISLLLRPTTPIKRSGNKPWLNLFAYLHNNILALQEFSNPAKQLRHVINLYTSRNHAASNAWLSSILDMTVKTQVATLKVNGRRCFTQGSEIIFELDPDQLENTSTMMFTHLLDFIAAHFVGFHSFIQVVIKFKGSEEEYIRCTRHHGYQMNR